MTVTPSALDIHRATLEADRSELHTCMPAEVVRVHAGPHGRQFVDVLPGLQRRVPNELGELVDEALPIIPMVPVGYLQGGGFFVSVPLAVGDIVTVVFAERSLDSWIETAKKGGKRAVIPGDVGTHTLQGAIVLPCGPSPRDELLQDVHAENLVIGKDDGVQIHITPDGLIGLGGAEPADFVALASKVDAFISTLDTLFRTGWVVAPSDGGAALKAAYAAAFGSPPASVASDVVKSD